VRFLERRFGITAPIGEWRRRVAGDLTSAFDFATPTAPPPVPPPVETVAGPQPSPAGHRWYPQVPAEQRMPVQEPGAKPARALPYQPDAEAVVRGRSV
ncbi:phospholipase C, phosphocholine-specific, partial [Escherichia coli]